MTHVCPPMFSYAFQCSNVKMFIIIMVVRISKEGGTVNDACLPSNVFLCFPMFQCKNIHHHHGGEDL